MNSATVANAHKQMGSPSKKLIVSYIFDWVIIIIFAAAGAGLSVVKPVHRPFSLLNLDISNPYVEETITTWMLGVIAFAVPVILIALITLIFVPGSHVRRTLPRAKVMRLKLWELEKGLAGLCLSAAVAFFITQGMKNMFGKPRPNLLARCEPDLSNIAEHVVSGWGQDLSARWTLVDSGICTQTDQSFLNDGFRSFPSGHSSFSWSGLLYLTLYFCSKFSIGLPHLPYLPTHRRQKTSPTADQELLPLHANRARGDSEETKRHDEENQNPSSSYTTTSSSTPSPLSLRSSSASPPNFLIIPALLPIAVAVYVCSTRYAEFYHFGFDIISGSLIGIATAYLSFRWYHLPISRGQGWAWGARSAERSFFVGVGSGGFVGDVEEGGREG